METSLEFYSVQTMPPLKFLWEMLSNPLNALTNLARINGDIAHVKVRNRDIYLLNHPEFIEQVLVRQQRKFVKGPSLQRAKLLLGEGLLTSEGEEHLTQRRALQPAFQRDQIEDTMPVMAVSTHKQITGWKDGQRVNMAEEMMRLTLDIALWSFFGHSPEGATERVGKAMKTLLKIFPLTMLPLPDSARGWFPRFRKASADLTLVTEALIANPQSVMAKNALIQILKQNNDGQFTDEQIRSHVLTFLLAGHETTALLLAWAWDMLAHHPHIQGKLQAEIDRVLGDRIPTAKDLERLVYTCAVVKETLRMRPPAWTIGRQAIEDCQIGGYIIPAGSTVITSQWVTHHDERYYAEPKVFRPERWLSRETASLPRFAFFPFGGGNRVCIGEYFAWTEAVVVLAIAARRWQVLPVHSNPATPQPSVTLRPKNGVAVIVEKRN
ncbi:MAG: cytochrome P450 [Chloroflexi bacterium]|nr:cytochrome P450 [Chloroflexota bacterium]